MDQPGLVERVDHLTAAVADLAFKLDTLLSSTTAFRESFGDRMTDYADLVAHWSIETEQNLATQRRSTERVVDELRTAAAERDEAITRLTALVEGLAEALTKAESRTLEGVEALGADVRRLADEPTSADALAAVLAEVAEVRKEIPEAMAALGPGGDLHSLAKEVRGLRRDLARLPDEQAALGQVAADLRELRELLAEADVEGAEDEAVFATALGEQLAALRHELVELRTRVEAKPAVPDEVLALTAELKALRSELENEPVAVAEAAAVEPDDRLQETLAELVFEVRALRRRFPVRADAAAAPTAEAAVGDEPPEAPATPPKRRRRPAD